MKRFQNGFKMYVETGVLKTYEMHGRNGWPMIQGEEKTPGVQSSNCRTCSQVGHIGFVTSYLENVKV